MEKINIYLVICGALKSHAERRDLLKIWYMKECSCLDQKECPGSLTLTH